ncbi:MAG: hypothetical protein ACM3PT_07330 [Deltaproteobacteria bacterium]
MRKLKLIIGILLGLSALSAVNAQTHYRRYYNDRDRCNGDTYYESDHYTNSKQRYISMDNLEYKIERANNRGELTGKELRKLESELYELKKYEYRVYRNHHVSYHERMRLEDKKRDLDRLIYELSHNCKRY